MLGTDVLTIRLGLEVVSVAAAPAVDEDGAALLVGVEEISLHVAVAVPGLLAHGADVVLGLLAPGQAVALRVEVVGVALAPAVGEGLALAGGGVVVEAREVHTAGAGASWQAAGERDGGAGKVENV